MNNHVKSAIVFPGQGGQHTGMGSELFCKYPELTQKASNILGYSVEELCLENPGDILNLTQYTQPALYVVNALSYLALQNRNANLKVDYLLGHSLGEYNALLAAGVFDFETGLRLVQKRGQLMSQARGGTMAAILNLHLEELKEILKEGSFPEVVIANYNTPTQLVVSGPVDSFANLDSAVNSKKGVYFPINVSAAFHSPLMNEAENEFEEFLKSFKFLPPSIPVIANATAAPYEDSNIAQLLSRQITSSVHWVESITYLLKQGEINFTEVYRDKLLNMIKQIRKFDINNILYLDKQKHIGKKKLSNTIMKDDISQSNIDSKIIIAEIPRQDSTLIDQVAINNFTLGSKDFSQKYKLKFPYLSGGMYRGISSKELVIKMGKASLMGFLGTGGLSLEEIADNIDCIKSELTVGESYGVNLLCNLMDESFESATVNLYLEKGVHFVEAAAYMQITKSLVWFRASGFTRDKNQNIVSRNNIMAKCSRLEVAERFMSPPPQKHLLSLVEEGKITRDQANMAASFPVSNEICVEADSGGHTDMGMPSILFPAFTALRNKISQMYEYTTPIHLGLAGGIGSPEAVLSSFILGADFILTGSINQCTPQAGQSDLVKDTLALMDIHDTDYAPAGDMFEIGAKIQVLKRGIFFPARAKLLHQLYTNYDSLEEIPIAIRERVEKQILKKSIVEVWEDVKQFFQKKGLLNQLELANTNPKHKMALIFRWYYGFSSKVTQQGQIAHKVDFQIHTGPALGSFNQWVKGTKLENWRERDVDVIADALMYSAQEKFDKFKTLI